MELSEFDDDEPTKKAIGYLVEYLFAYEKDILLQSTEAVQHRGRDPFHYWKTMKEGDNRANRHGDTHGWQVHKIHSRATLRHGAMRQRDVSVTVNLDSARANPYRDVERILEQWVDNNKINKDIRVSIDVLYARTRHGGPPLIDVVAVVSEEAVSPVKKKPVCLQFYGLSWH